MATPVLQLSATFSATFWNLAIKFGVISFVFLFAISVIFTRYLNWRLDRVYSWVGSWGCLDSSKPNFRLLVCSISTLIYLLVLVPCLLVPIWGLFLALNESPPIFGIGIATVFPSLLVLFYALQLWRSKRFRLQSSPNYRVGALHWSLVAIFVLLCCFELAAVFVQPELSYVGLTWVFFMLNILPIVSIVFLNASSATGDVSSWMSARSADARSEFGRRNSIGETKGETARPATHSTTTGVDSGSLVSALTAAQGRGTRRSTILLYTIALLILVVYATLNFVFASNAVDSGKQLGFVTATSVLVLDLVSYLSFQGGLITSPGPLCMLMLGSRAALVSFGATYWFLGHTTVYLVYGCTLAYLTAVQLIPVPGATVRLPGMLNTPRIGRHPSGRFMTLVTRPLSIFLLLTWAFLVLMAVSAAAPSGLPSHTVPGITNPHAQWEFGLAALAIVWVTLFTVATRQAGTQLHDADMFSLDRRGWIFACATEGIVLLFTVLLRLSTTSNLLLAFGLFAPPGIVCSVFAYYRWRRNDFQLLGSHTNRRNTFSNSTADPEAGAETKGDGFGDGSGDGSTDGGEHKLTGGDDAPGNRWSSGVPLCGDDGADCGQCVSNWKLGDFRAMACLPAFFRCGLPRRDYLTLGAVAVASLSLFAFCLVVSLSVNPMYLGWVAGAAVLEVFLTYISAVQWFNTLERTAGLISNLVITSVTHCFVHFFLLSQMTQTKTMAAVLFSFVVYPTLVLLSCAWYKWRDDKWVAGRFVKVCFILATCILLIASIIVMVFLHLMAGVACMVATLLGMFSTVTIGVWASNGFYLSPRWRLLALVILLAVAALGICAGFLGDGLQAFLAFSVSWGCLALFLGLYSISALFRVKTSRLLSFSVFPVYSFVERDTNVEVVPANSPFAAAYLTALVMFLWGAAATVLLPVVYIGLAVIAVVSASTVIFTIHSMRAPRRDFAQACLLLQSASDKRLLGRVLRTSFDVALSAQMGQHRGQSVELRKAESLGSEALRRASVLLSSAQQVEVDDDGTQSVAELLARVAVLEDQVNGTFTCGLFTGGASYAVEAPGESRARARSLAPQELEAALKELKEVDELLNRAQSDEFAFSAHMRALVLLAAKQELEDAKTEFRALLSWCHQPASAEAIRDVGDDIYSHLVSNLTLGTSRPVSVEQVYQWADSDPELFARFLAVRQLHCSYLEAQSLDRQRREREDQEAARRRIQASKRAQLAKRERAASRWKAANAAESAAISERKAAERAARLAQWENARRKLEEDSKQAAERAQAEEQRKAEENLLAEQKRAADEASRLEAMEAAARVAEHARLEAEREIRRRQAAEARAERARVREEARRKQEQELADERAAEEERVRQEEAQLIAARIREQEEAAAVTTTSAIDGESPALLRARASCSNDAPFVDIDFQGDEAIYMDPEQPCERLAVAEWARPSQLYPRPTVAGAAAADGTVGKNWTRPEDISQGQLGDCWLLSAMSVLARRPELMAKVLAVKSYNEAGVYAVNLFKNGRWEQIVVDDRLPSLHRPTRADPNHLTPAYVRSKEGGRLWMSIIEKAYAKYHGSYEAIEGGLVHLGLVDLTGGAGEEIKLADPATRRQIGSGALWERLVQYSEAGHLLGAGSPAGSDTNVSAMGIVQGHAYAVLRVAQEHDSNGTHHLLQLRNPWGQTEWTGDWSDDDRAHWTRRIRKRLGYDPHGGSDDDDGVFWMSFADFTQHFSSIYVCRLFSEVQDGGSWYRYTATDRWEGTTAGGCPTKKNANARHNPQFYLQVSRPCTVFITLTQENAVLDHGDAHHVAFFLLDKKGKRCRAIFKGNVKGTSGKFINSRQVSAELTNLQPNPNGPYTLYCSTFLPGLVADIRVQVYSDHPLDPSCCTTGADGSLSLNAIPADTPAG